MNIEKELIENIVKESSSRKECFEKLGLHSKSNYSYKIFNYYKGLYNLNTSHFTPYKKANPQNNIAIELSLVDILSGKHPLYSTSKLKAKLLKHNIFEYKCDVCNLTEWCDKPIPLDLDHINGVPTDHTLSNLRLICRNCHAQTNNFCGKNQSKSNYVSKKSIKLDKWKQISNERLDTTARRKYIVLNSDIEFSKYGWVEKLAKEFNLSPQKINKWMKTHMPEFYYEKCFIRKKELAGAP